MIAFHLGRKPAMHRLVVAAATALAVVVAISVPGVTPIRTADASLPSDGDPLSSPMITGSRRSLLSSPQGALAADASLSSPFASGSLTLIHGYNDPPIGAYCPRAGSGPTDHCGNQRYGIDLASSNPADTRILSPLPGRISWISGDCLGINTDDGLDLTVCHFKSFIVGWGNKVPRGAVLGYRSTSWIHLSLDRSAKADPNTPPVPFAGAHAIVGISLLPNDAIRNTYGGRPLGSTSVRSLGRPNLDECSKQSGRGGASTAARDAPVSDDSRIFACRSR